MFSISYIVYSVNYIVCTPSESFLVVIDHKSWIPFIILGGTLNKAHTKCSSLIVAVGNSFPSCGDISVCTFQCANTVGMSTESHSVWRPDWCAPSRGAGLRPSVLGPTPHEQEELQRG